MAHAGAWAVVWPFAGAVLGLGDGLVGCDVVPQEALPALRGGPGPGEAG